jgi:hypothetical protein
MISDAGFDARADRYDASMVGRRFHGPVQAAVVERRPEVEAMLQDAGLQPIGWETVFCVVPDAIIRAVIARSAG